MRVGANDVAEGETDKGKKIDQGQKLTKAKIPGFVGKGTGTGSQLMRSGDREAEIFQFCPRNLSDQFPLKLMSIHIFGHLEVHITHVFSSNELCISPPTQSIGLQPLFCIHLLRNISFIPSFGPEMPKG